MILVANGVNLDLLGRREPEIYGSQTLKDLESYMCKEWMRYDKEFSNKKNIPKLVFFQSNDEGKFLESLTEKNYEAFILNAGAWSHTSLALGDRCAALTAPIFEVHLSNLSKREEIRQKSFVAPHAKGVVYGAGFAGYAAALRLVFDCLK